MKTNDVAPGRVIERIRRRIKEIEGGCWEWQGALSTAGYGRIAWAHAPHKMTYASVHRVLYTVDVGPIPKGLDLDHLCRVRRCVNPEHLEPVSRSENLLRGDTVPARRAAVTRCPRGHEYSPENTLVSRRGQRSCKECTYAANRAYYHANRDRRRAQNKAWREARKSG